MHRFNLQCCSVKCHHVVLNLNSKSDTLISGFPTLLWWSRTIGSSLSLFGSLCLQYLVCMWEAYVIQSTYSLWSRVRIKPRWSNTHYDWNWIIHVGGARRTTSLNYNDNMPIYIMLMYILTAKHVCFAFVFIAGHGEFRNYKRVFFYSPLLS